MRHFAVLLLSLLAATAAQAQIIGTVAGGGPDNLPATQSNVFPSALAIDGAGNVYFTQCSIRSRVYKVDTTGVLTVFAGTGTAAFTGDGGPAAKANLNCPSGLAVDAAGNVFITDANNQRVRRVDAATLIITTIAGTGTSGFSGDGGPAGSARLTTPIGLAFDASGNLYVSDQGNRRIRRIAASGGAITSSSTITTVAGNGNSCAPTTAVCGDGIAGGALNAQFSAPRGLAFDSAGNLYIADATGNRMRRMDTTNTLSTVAGTGTAGSAGDGGQATAAQLNNPYAEAFDGLGNMFIADRGPFGSGLVRKVVLSTGIITTVPGATSLPEGVATDSLNNLYISNTFSAVLLKRTPSGTITTFAGNFTTGFSGDGASATSASLMTPGAAVFDSSGNLFIGDGQNRRVRRVDAATGIVTTVAGNGQDTFNGDNIQARNAAIGVPAGLAFDSAGNLFIASSTTARVRRVIPGADGLITGATDELIGTVAGSGTTCSSPTLPCGDGGPATSANMGSPNGLAFDSSGSLHIAETNLNRVRRVGPGADSLITGAVDELISTVAGNGTDCSSSPATCGDGGPATSANIRQPRGVAVDSSGNLFIQDGRNRIRRVAAGADGKVTGAADEIISNAAGSASGGAGFGGDTGPATSALLNGPTGLSFDSPGNLYIADQGNNRIRRVEAVAGAITSASKITTVAGSGVFAFSGDGGLAVDAGLANPSLARPDGAGNLYIADQSNDRIRRVDTTHPVPSVSSISPPTRPQGGTAFVLSVIGANLTPDSVIRFSGSDRTTTYVSSTQLQTSIPASDIAVDGSFPITVFNPTPGGGLSNAVSLQVLRTTSTSVNCSPSLVPINSPTACTAVVSDTSPGTASAPSGTVSGWFETHGFPGSASPSSCALNPINATQSSCSVMFTPGINASSNSYQLAAVYSGDHNGSSFTTPLGALTPVRRSESASVNCVPNPVVASSASTCTVTVTDTDIPTAVTPTGTVTLTSNQPSGTFSPAANCVLSGSGASASCSVTYNQSAVANATISAVHSPTSPISTNDRNHGGSNGSVGLTVVSPDSTPPVIAPNVTGTLGNNGWYVSNVSVSWNVMDTESAVSTMTGCGSSSVTTDTASVTFTCTATSAGGTASNSVTIKRDTTPPVIAAHVDASAEAVSAAGAVVNYASSATSDNMDGAGTAICLVASGNTFALGNTTVTCNASDSAGNAATASTFVVHVIDSTPPVITGTPANMTLEATGPAGAAAAWVAPNASDTVDGSVAVNCLPVSGSTFAIGTTTVNCTATDAHGNAGSGSFSVTVGDTTPPVIAAHVMVVAEAASAAGAVVSYTNPPTTDAVSGAGMASCAPLSGSPFALGDTTVTCNAADAAGNPAVPVTFTVRVGDTVSPSIAITSPVNGGTYLFGAAGAANYGCADAVSAIASCLGTVPNGAVFATAPLGVRSFTVVASDAAGNTSSYAVDYTVAPAPTTLSLTSDNTPSLFGVPVKFTATLASASPVALATGTVTFKEGATVLGTGTLAAGIATFTTSTLAIGNHNITAVYAGNGNFLGATSAVRAEAISPSAALRVTFVVHTILDDSRRPRTRMDAVEGAEVRVYVRKDICTNGLVVTGQPKIWGKIFDGLDGPGGTDTGCPVVDYGNYVAKGITNSDGKVTIIVPPTSKHPDEDYVIIGHTDDYDVTTTPAEPDDLYSGNTIETAKAGVLKEICLRRIRMYNGKRVPAKFLEEFGSYLAIIEPEYMDWSNPQELYPVVLVAEGDWTVTTSVAPPEGFVPDTPELSATVTNATEAVQFTLTDVGSSWTHAATTYVIQHKGETRVRVSKIPMFNRQPSALAASPETATPAHATPRLEPYHFIGFNRPVENTPQTNLTKPGSVVLLQWQLLDSSGAYLSGRKTFQSLLSAPAECDASPVGISENQFEAAGTAELKYEQTANRFSLRWETSRAWSGCRLAQVTLADGTRHYAMFKFE